MTSNAPICLTIDCSNEASINDYFPNSEGGRWTYCFKCYKKNNEDTDTDDDYNDNCDECGLHPKEAGMTYDGAFGLVEMCRWCYIETLKSKVERLEEDNTKLNKSLKKKTKLIKKMRKDTINILKKVTEQLNEQKDKD